MKRALSLAVVPLLLGPSHALAADEVRVLAPASGWTLDFADERCSLVREFDDGDGSIRLQIDSFGPSPGYRVMISGDLVPGSDSAPVTEFRVGYSPDTRERDRVTTIVGTFGNENAVSFGKGFLPLSPPRAGAPEGEFERGVNNVTIAFRLREPLLLDTGSMTAPFSAMHRCVDDLIASWGIDPAVHRALSRPPLLRNVDVPEGYTRLGLDPADDHPGWTERRARATVARVARAGEAVPVRVMIDATGQPTACVLQVATRGEAYRQLVCGLLAGPYWPALDAEGRPVASFLQFNTR